VDERLAVSLVNEPVTANAPPTVEEIAELYRKRFHRHDPPPEHARDFGMLLASLPDRQRLVLFLRYYADLDYRGIAAALNIEVGTVAATLHKGHAAIRRSFEEAHR